MKSGKRGTVLVADDHSLYRAGLSFLLKDRLGFRAVIEAASFDVALDRLADTAGVELALLDLSMPGVSGPDSLRIVKEIYPDLRVAIISGSEDRKDVLAAVSMGLGGYVPKSLTDDVIVSAIEGMLDGRIYVPRFMTGPAKGTQTETANFAAASGNDLKAKTGAAGPAKPISPRQRDVLDGVRKGLSNKEIARQLDIAEGTVKIHLAALFSNYGVRNRTELATKT